MLPLAGEARYFDKFVLKLLGLLKTKPEELETAIARHSPLLASASQDLAGDSQASLDALSSSLVEILRASRGTIRRSHCGH